MHFALSESGKDRERKERIEKEKEHIQASATEDGPNRLQATEPVHNTPSRALVGSQPASPVKSPPPKGGHRRTRDARRQVTYYSNVTVRQIRIKYANLN